jgi:hypothetical protein
VESELGIETDRPDFKVNSPNSSTPFLSAAWMKATFSASIPPEIFETDELMMIVDGCVDMHAEREEEKEEKEKRTVDEILSRYLGRS